MNGRAALVIAMAALLAGCPGTKGDGPAELLALKVTASEAQPFEEFNQTLAKAAGEPWTKDAMMVARRFSGWGGERSGTIALQGSGERPSRYQAIVIADGFVDDSLRGRRLDLVLQRGSDETWRVTEARASFRCWDGRGHQEFGTEACH